MKMNILKIATLTSALLLGNAYATEIYVDLDDAGATPTLAMDTLNIIYDSHTTINLATGAVHTLAGVDAIGVDFGFLANPIFADTADLVGCGTICGVSNTLASDPNYLGLVEQVSSGMALTFGIDLMGMFDGTDLNYSSGVLDVYSYDMSDANASRTKVFTSNFVSGSVLAGEQRVNTLIADSSEVLVDDTFFFDINGVLTSFEDYLSMPLAQIRIAIQQFVNSEQLAADVAASMEIGSGHNDFGAFLGDTGTTVHVTANHNASVTFDVPEPTSIAILGLGLLGLAGVKRRKS